MRSILALHTIAVLIALSATLTAKADDEGPGLIQQVETLQKQVSELSERLAVIEKWLKEYQIVEAELQNVGINPGPIAATGNAVTADTPLDPGTLLQAEWNGEWWAARVLEALADGKVTIHYVGWDSSWDETVDRSRLQLDADAAEKARATLSNRFP